MSNLISVRVDSHHTAMLVKTDVKKYSVLFQLSLVAWAISRDNIVLDKFISLIWEHHNRATNSQSWIKWISYYETVAIRLSSKEVVELLQR